MKNKLEFISSIFQRNIVPLGKLFDSVEQVPLLVTELIHNKKVCQCTYFSILFLGTFGNSRAFRRCTFQMVCR